MITSLNLRKHLAHPSPRLVLGIKGVCLPLLALLLLASFGAVSGQSRDIRSHSEYGNGEGALRLKYEFYHDMWSERDVKHGRYTEWAKKGDRLKLNGYYFDGLQDSLWQFWRRGGHLRETSNWDAGLRQGKTALYGHCGHLATESNYRQGKLEGLQIDYRPNGKVSRVAQYHRGRLHGKVTQYNRKGEATRFLDYVEGKVQKQPRRERPATDSLAQPEPREKGKTTAPSTDPQRPKEPATKTKLQTLPTNKNGNPDNTNLKRPDQQSQ